MEIVCPVIRYNVQLLAADMASNGWAKLDFARAAEVSDMTVIRFLRGDHQTPRTAAKLAPALGRPVERYLIRSEQGAAA